MDGLFVTGTIALRPSWRQKDATEAQSRIREVNSGLMAVKADCLQRWLDGLDNNNEQNEYYLTDIVARAVADGITVKPVVAEANIEILGIIPACN